MNKYNWFILSDVESGTKLEYKNDLANFFQINFTFFLYYYLLITRRFGLYQYLLHGSENH